MAAPGQHSESRLYFDDSLSGSGAEDLALTWLEDVASDASLDPQLLGEDDALPAQVSGDWHAEGGYVVLPLVAQERMA